MDRLAKKLESVYNASGGKKINIISHSMGGLLVKCFMCLHSDVKNPSLFNLFKFVSISLYSSCNLFVSLLLDFDLAICFLLFGEVYNFVPFVWQIFEKYVKNWVAIAAPFQGKQFCSIFI